MSDGCRGTSRKFYLPPEIANASLDLDAFGGEPFEINVDFSRPDYAEISEKDAMAVLGMEEPTDLEREVADAIAEALTPNDMEGWIVTGEHLDAARAAIETCFRWRPIETAPSHYVLDDPRQATFSPAAADGGEIVVKRVGAREYWFRLPPPPEPEDGS